MILQSIQLNQEKFNKVSSYCYTDLIWKQVKYTKKTWKYLHKGSETAPAALTDSIYLDLKKDIQSFRICNIFFILRNSFIKNIILLYLLYIKWVSVCLSSKIPNFLKFLHNLPYFPEMVAVNVYLFSMSY